MLMNILSLAQMVTFQIPDAKEDVDVSLVHTPNKKTVTCTFKDSQNLAAFNSQIYKITGSPCPSSKNPLELTLTEDIFLTVANSLPHKGKIIIFLNDIKSTFTVSFIKFPKDKYLQCQFNDYGNAIEFCAWADKQAIGFEFSERLEEAAKVTLERTENLNDLMFPIPEDLFNSLLKKRITNPTAPTNQTISSNLSFFGNIVKTTAKMLYTIETDAKAKTVTCTFTNYDELHNFATCADKLGIAFNFISASEDIMAKTVSSGKNPYESRVSMVLPEAVYEKIRANTDPSAQHIKEASPKVPAPSDLFTISADVIERELNAVAENSTAKFSLTENVKVQIIKLKNEYILMGINVEVDGKCFNIDKPSALLSMITTMCTNSGIPMPETNMKSGLVIQGLSFPNDHFLRFLRNLVNTMFIDQQLTAFILMATKAALLKETVKNVFGIPTEQPAPAPKPTMIRETPQETAAKHKQQFSAEYAATCEQHTLEFPDEKAITLEIMDLGKNKKMCRFDSKDGLQKFRESLKRIDINRGQREFVVILDDYYRKNSCFTGNDVFEVRLEDAEYETILKYRQKVEKVKAQAPEAVDDMLLNMRSVLTRFTTSVAQANSIYSTTDARGITFSSDLAASNSAAANSTNSRPRGAEPDASPQAPRKTP